MYIGAQLGATDRQRWDQMLASSLGRTLPAKLTQRENVERGSAAPPVPSKDMY